MAGRPRMDRPLTTGEVAERLGVHERTVRRYISLGLLRHVRLPGGHYRVPENALSEFMGGSRQRPHRGELLDTSPRGAARPHARSHLRAEPPYDLSPSALAALRARMS